MIRAIILFIVAFQFGLANGQLNYVQTYPMTQWPTVKDLDVFPDGSMVMAIRGNGFWGTSIVRLDALGEVRSSISYMGSGYDFLAWDHVIAMPDHSIIALGTGGNWTSSYQKIAMRMDSSGTVLWSHTSGSPSSNGDWYRGIDMISPDSLLVGTHNPSLYGGRASFDILNPIDGSFTEGLNCGELPNDPYSSRDVIRTADGKNMLLSHNGANNVLIIKAEADFTPIWKNIYEEIDAHSIIALPDSTVMFAGSDHLAKLDLNGDTIWCKELIMAGGKISDMLLRSDDKILLCGWADQGNKFSWLMLLDADGNTLWTRRYGGTGDNYEIFKVVELANTDLRLIGHSDNDDGLLIAVDSSGILTNCQQLPPTFSWMPHLLNYSNSSIPTQLSVSFNHQPFVPVDSVAPLASVLECASIPPYHAYGCSFIDANMNGVKDPGEASMNFSPVTIMPNSGYIIPSADGCFDFLAPSIGNYQLKQFPPNLLWGMTTQSVYPITFTTTDTLFENIDFGFAPVVDTTLLTGSLVVGRGVCEAVVEMDISIMNVGTNTPQGVAELQLDPLYTFISSIPAPDSIVGTSHFWSFDSLSWYQSWQQTLLLELPGTANLGDTMEIALVIHQDDGFGNISWAWSHVWTSQVSCSFDPNDKLVTPKGVYPNGAIPFDTEWLNYTIRFQNTGNDTAYSVIIRDQLSDHLNYETLQILNTSHLLSETSITNSGLAMFNFEEIILPDSGANQIESQGFVSFRIAPNYRPVHGTIIINSALIYFDLNQPVQTNTVSNLFVNCAQVNTDPSIVDHGGGLLRAFTYAGDTMLYTYIWHLDGIEISGASDSLFTATISGEYSVALVDLYGCTGISNTLNIQSTQISEILTGSIIHIIPNPFSEKTRIVLSEPLGINDRLEVIGIHGRILRSVEGTGSKEIILERNELKSGMYLLKYERSGQFPVSKRIVVH